MPLAPSLRYSPSCDPVYPSDTAKAARARLLGLCCFLPPVLLPSRASALSFLAGLRLSPSPRALVLLGFVCPPCGPLSWLVLVAPPSVCFWFVLLAWPDFCFVWFVWFCCFVRPWLVSLFCVLLLVASLLDRYARIFCFHLRTKAFVTIGLMCLSADWTGSLVLLTSPVHLVFAFVLLCDYPQSTEMTHKMSSCILFL